MCSAPCCNRNNFIVVYGILSMHLSKVKILLTQATLSIGVA